MSARMSPDGMYYWDGQRWVSTLSPDGRFRWNGAAWEPVPPGFYQARRTMREPTSWTRPLQYAVIAWYGISALVSVSLPFWMGQTMNDMINQSLQRQEATTGQPLPPGFADMMSSMMTGIFWVSAIFGLALAVVAIVATLRLWTWAYYAIVVLLGLGLVSLPINLVDALSGGLLNNVQGFTMPVWIFWFGVASGLVGGALFVWMLVALVKRGPWGMRKVS